MIVDDIFPPCLAHEIGQRAEFLAEMRRRMILLGYAPRETVTLPLHPLEPPGPAPTPHPRPS